MHMSDIFVVASFDATNFPQYIYGRGLWGSPLLIKTWTLVGMVALGALSLKTATFRNEHIF